MIALAAIVLVLLPAAAMAYPFLRKRRLPDVFEDESSPQAELARRWEATLASLKNAELEWALGNLGEEDYRWLRQRYLAEAATLLKAMDLEYQQEEEQLARIEREVAAVRRRVLGTGGETASSPEPTSQTPKPPEGRGA